MVQIFEFLRQKMAITPLIEKIKILFDDFLKYFIFKYLTPKFRRLQFLKKSTFLARKFKSFSNQMNVTHLAPKIDNDTKLRL